MGNVKIDMGSRTQGCGKQKGMRQRGQGGRWFSAHDRGTRQRYTCKGEVVGGKKESRNGMQVQGMKLESMDDQK